MDAAGNIYIADSVNNVIREVSASTGLISTVAGGGIGGCYLNDPGGVAVDQYGNLFIADSGNNVIREVLKSTGLIYTVVGTGMHGSYGDNGSAGNAELWDPEGVAVNVDLSGRSISTSPTPSTTWFARCRGPRYPRACKGRSASRRAVLLGGHRQRGYSGDGGYAIYAQLNQPEGVAVDAAGNLFIADTHNNVVREVLGTTGPKLGSTGPIYPSGYITTVAGTYNSGIGGYSGDLGLATSAS